MVTFGEVARQVKTKVKPADTDLELYVGLEHLDPESLRIRRGGVPEDVTGEKIVVRKGDIIFGKRRAYQRKVAIADFDCICSAHAMVLRPKEDVIIKELLPFFLQSDQFMNRAVQISVGGLSPTINWKDLARQEFPLPPIDEQRRIAEILWAAEDVIVKNEAFAAEMEHYKQLMMRDLFRKGIGHEEFREVRRLGVVPRDVEILSIGDVCDKMQYGLSLPGSEQGQYPLLRMSNLSNGELALNDLQYVDLDQETLSNYVLNKGDILFNRTNSIDHVGKTSLFNLTGEYVFASYLIRVCPDSSSIIPKFLNYYLNCRNSQIWLRHLATKGVSQCNINAQVLGGYPIPIFSISEQEVIVDILEKIDSANSAARASVEASKALKMRLINQLLSGSATV